MRTLGKEESALEMAKVRPFGREAMWGHGR